MGEGVGKPNFGPDRFLRANMDRETQGTACLKGHRLKTPLIRLPRELQKVLYTVTLDP